MDNSLENVFDALGFSDGENVDMLRPVREPCAPIGRASHRHSSDYPDPTDMLYSDEESMHFDTPNPYHKGRLLCMMTLTVKKRAISPLVVWGTPRVGLNYPKVV